MVYAAAVARRTTYWGVRWSVVCTTALSVRQRTAQHHIDATTVVRVMVMISREQCALLVIASYMGQS